MDVHPEFVFPALIQVSLIHVHLQWRRGLKTGYTGTCQTLDPRMKDVLCWRCAHGTWLQKGLLKVLPPRAHHAKTVSSVLFCIEDHMKLCNLQELTVVKHHSINVLTHYSFVHASLTLVGVIKTMLGLRCWKDLKNKARGKKNKAAEGMNGSGWIFARKLHTKKKKTSCLLN